MCVRLVFHGHDRYGIHQGRALCVDTGRRILESIASPAWRIGNVDRGIHCRLPQLAAGTVSGIFISHDEGKNWRRIAPAGDMESQPVVSLAFAPDSVRTLYAGTPKLPWKTTDDGKTWNPIHVGILDDSDIFSIVVEPDRILIGACSGIYRSEDGGVTLEKKFSAFLANRAAPTLFAWTR
jgi:hypothetical protein